MAQVECYYHHHLSRPGYWQPRPEFDALCKWWHDLRFGVCALIGVGGAGKTEIIDRFLRVLPSDRITAPHGDIPRNDSLPLPRRLFVWSFEQTPKADMFFRELASWLRNDIDFDSSSQAAFAESIHLLSRVERPCLLILDSIEELLDDSEPSSDLRDLLKRAIDGLLPGVSIVLTSRRPPYQVLYQHALHYEEIVVEKLSDQASIAIMRAWGVARGSDSALTTLCHAYGNHALAVSLLSAYIAENCNGDPTRILGLMDNSSRQSCMSKGGILLNRILKHCILWIWGQRSIEVEHPESPNDGEFEYEINHRINDIANWHANDLGRHDEFALYLLERLCFPRHETDLATLRRMLAVNGWRRRLHSPDNSDRLRSGLQLLVRRGLARVDESNKYAVHEALRSVLRARVRRSKSRKIHNAIADFILERLGGPENLPVMPTSHVTLDQLEDAIYHKLKAGEVRRAWELFANFVGSFRHLGYSLGMYEQCERICRMFLNGEHGVKPEYVDKLTPWVQIELSNLWGVCLKQLGQLQTAMSVFTRCAREDFRIAERYRRNKRASAILKEDHQNLSVANQNISSCSVLIGDLSQAVKTAHAAVEHADASDSDEMFRARTYLARAYTLRGRIADALTYFNEALNLQNQRRYRSLASLLNVHGVYHAQLIIRVGQLHKARDMLECNLDALPNSKLGRQDSIPEIELVLADLLRATGDFASGREILGQAASWADRRNAKELLCYSALVKSTLELEEWQTHSSNLDSEGSLRDAGKIRQAIEDGLRIARDCGYGIYHIDLLLVRAQLALHEGRTDDAMRDLTVALEDGINPTPESGAPKLLAAGDPNCNYKWGIAEGHQLRGEALLLQAGQALDKSEFDPTALDELPKAVRTMIDEARGELRSALDIWRRLRDPESDAEMNPRGQRTQLVLQKLADGRLTCYPVGPPIMIKVVPPSGRDWLPPGIEKGSASIPEIPYNVIYDPKRFQPRAGAMGQVWLGQGTGHPDAGDAPDVVLKFFDPDPVSIPFGSPDWMNYHQLFASEAALGQSVTGDHLVKQHLQQHYDPKDGNDWRSVLVMERVAGSLSDLLQNLSGRHLPLNVICKLAVDWASGLARLHSEYRLVHNDIQPGNLFVRIVGRRVESKWMQFVIEGDLEAFEGAVGDFGVAQHRDSGRAAHLFHCSADEFKAPEQDAKNAGKQEYRNRPDPRTDLFGFGRVLQQLQHVCTPSYPDSLHALLAQCCAKNVDDRPGSARHLLAQLSKVCSGKPGAGQAVHDLPDEATIVDILTQLIEAQFERVVFVIDKHNEIPKRTAQAERALDLVRLARARDGGLARLWQAIENVRDRQP